ncbi:MAG TPA: hypothetical protein VF057_06265, partial [Thermoanaerobaculia bacterium]
MRAASHPILPVALSSLFVTLACTHIGDAGSAAGVRSGAAVLGDDWKTDAPGVRRLIRPSDLPTPAMPGSDPEASVASPAKVVGRPQGTMPRVPEGFTVQVFASGLKQPRRIRIAPNGDIFVSESGTGRVLV